MSNCTKIRVADFIIDRLYNKYDIRYIPLVTGNGALVINDAIAKYKKIIPVCCHGEQYCGYVALGMSKYTNKLSVVNPTTGCASTNCITPLLAAYQDHVPILFLSGNVALYQTTRYHKLHNNINLKKLGIQELDIIEIVKPLTKYSVMIEDVKMVQYELDKAIDIALTPPFGPVFYDLPADIGASLIEEKDLIEYENICVRNVEYIKNRFNKIEQIDNLKKDLETYERPLILAGQGISLSNSREQFKQFLEKYNIPAVFSYGGIDLIDYNSKYWVGVAGIKGTRAGNFAIQNADLILILGCCLNISQVGYMSEKFAPNVKKIVVDICAENHNKNIGVKIDQIIECELREFFEYIL